MENGVMTWCDLLVAEIFTKNRFGKSLVEIATEDVDIHKVAELVQKLGSVGGEKYTRGQWVAALAYLLCEAIKGVLEKLPGVRQEGKERVTEEQA